MPNYARNRGPGSNLGILILFYEIFHVIGIDNIPIVTLSTVVGQVLLYLGVIQVAWDKRDVCISAEKMLRGKFDWRVLTMSLFEHADDRHLYYNMISFVMKGRELERLYGGANFAILMAVLGLMTNGMYVALAQLGYVIFEDTYYLKVCAIGFSGVIFALKVITSCESHPLSVSYVFGIPVSTRYVAWVELIVIHFIAPQASFIGHLGGILAGLLYTSTPVGAFIDETIERITGNPVIHNECFYTVR